MIISELIEQLRRQLHDHGDIEVCALGLDLVPDDDFMVLHVREDRFRAENAPKPPYVLIDAR